MILLVFTSPAPVGFFVTDRISASATAKSKLSKELNGASPHKNCASCDFAVSVT